MQHTTTRERFTVGCDWCGHLDGFKSYRDAHEYAESIWHNHLECPGVIRVFDIMAHQGQPEMWDVNGFIIRHKDMRDVATREEEDSIVC